MQKFSITPFQDIRQTHPIWLTNFFETILNLFQPLIANPLSLKIIYDNEERTITNNPHEILSYIQIEVPLYSLIKEKIAQMQKECFQMYSAEMLVFVCQTILTILEIRKNFGIEQEDLFNTIKLCESETIKLLKLKKCRITPKLADVNSAHYETALFQIGNRSYILQELVIGDEEYTSKELLQTIAPELSQEDIEELKSVAHHFRKTSMSVNILDIKRGLVYSQGKKRFDLGVAFSFPITYSNFPHQNEEIELETLDYEILLLDINQEEASDFFSQKNFEQLQQFRVIFTTTFVNDKLRDSLTSRKVKVLSNLRFLDLKAVTSEKALSIL